MKQLSSLVRKTSNEAPESALDTVKTLLKQFPHVRTALRLLLESEEKPLMLSSVGGKCSPHKSRQNHACLRTLESEGIVSISTEASSPPLIVIIQGMQNVVRQALEDIAVVDNGNARPMTKKKKTIKERKQTTEPKGIVESFNNKPGLKRLLLLYILVEKKNLLLPDLLRLAGLNSSLGAQTIKPLLDMGIVVSSDEKERQKGQSTRSASYRIFLSKNGREMVESEYSAIRDIVDEQGWIDEDGNF